MGIDTGFDTVLVKPIDLVRLQELLAEAARLVGQAKRLASRTHELIEHAKRHCADLWALREQRYPRPTHAGGAN